MKRAMTQPDSASEDPNPTFSCAARQTGKAVIRDIIKRHKKRASDLEAFLAMLPETITNEQDNALWNVVTSIERGV